MSVGDRVLGATFFWERKDGEDHFTLFKAENGEVVLLNTFAKEAEIIAACKALNAEENMESKQPS